MVKKSSRFYPFKEVEEEVKVYWRKEKVIEIREDKKERAYILDMFPYPSGRGLHVGHLLGYFASDVRAVKARMEGAEVLHPMGFDAFGLPAEQHAIETGEHPSRTVAENIETYKKLLEATGISFTWDRLVTTTDPNYYRWTQWIFLQLFDSWYNKAEDRAESINTLRKAFEQGGSEGVVAACAPETPSFTAEEWEAMEPEAQEDILRDYRLAYLSYGMVNWCPGLGSVLANDEVKEGFSERGGYPVERKKMRQWSLRMTAYADRLLEGLADLEWAEEVKEMQKNWIGKSQGTAITFKSSVANDLVIEVFTTRPDTLFGATFLALAPEHPIVEKILAAESNSSTIDLSLDKGALASINNSSGKGSDSLLADYVAQAMRRSSQERMQGADKEVTGVFTGHYALHPFTGDKLPIWVVDYVLPGYGSGAVMGVPAHDERDYKFAKCFDLPIISVIEPRTGVNVEGGVYSGKEGIVVNADFLNGLSVVAAQESVTKRLEERGQGRRTIHYRLRDPVFSRQRYWGEPIPIYYKEGRPYPLPIDSLPLLLPAIDDYKPTSSGEPPLARAKGWSYNGYPLEKHTMPAWAGSSWYFLRYMDPKNEKSFVTKEKADQWGSVDLYMGGREHTTGHLIYARFFNHFLYDRGYISFKEPFRKLVNQGMIQGYSRFVYRIKGSQEFVSYGLRDKYATVPMRVDIGLVKDDKLDMEGFRKWRPDLANASFITEDGAYICGKAVEKLSKSKYNTIDPQVTIDRYGADALRMYLFFLGPIQQDKPWNEKGLGGIKRFMDRVWHFYQAPVGSCATDDKEENQVQKIIHQAIKRVQEGIDRFAFNTSISALMICIRNLAAAKCNDPMIRKIFLQLLAPFAPHMAEYLWQSAGEEGSVLRGGFPLHDPAYLVSSTVRYPVTVNGKLRAQLEVPADNTAKDSLRAAALALPTIQKWTKGKRVKQVVVVLQKIINIVVDSA